MKKLIISIALVVAATTASAQTPTATGAIVRGVVTSITGPTITVMRNVKIDVSSALIRRGQQAANADALLVGSRVLAVISPSPSPKPGVLAAEAVTIDPAEGSIIGPVTSLSATSVVVDGQTIAVDASTLFNGYYGKQPVHAASDVVTGAPVAVEVASVASGLVALEVRVLGPAPLAPPAPPLDEKTITGVVTAIAADAWTVGTTKVNITGKTTISTPTPKVGDTVTVTGVKLPDGALIASTIVGN
jgi:hypothetical protein